MSKHHVKISPEVLEVINKSVIGADRVILPSQLERKLYEQTNKVLALAGGKWSKGAQAHVFPNDPREALGLAVEQGEIKDKKKANQAFYTPKDLAKKVVKLAGIEVGDLVLEPSAGLGMLALEARDQGGVVDCVEIDPESAEALRRLVGLGDVHQGDFLSMKLNHTGGELYDRIVMNPPFASGQDIQHVTHAFNKFLHPEGTLVAIMSTSWVESTMSRAKKLWDLIHSAARHEIIHVPAGTFKGSGTNIATVILVLKK